MGDNICTFNIILSIVTIPTDHSALRVWMQADMVHTCIAQSVLGLFEVYVDLVIQLLKVRTTMPVWSMFSEHFCIVVTEEGPAQPSLAVCIYSHQLSKNSTII